MLLLTGKGIFISILAAIFFGFFGCPSYVKYQKRETVFMDTRVKFDSRKSVGITFFAWQKTLLNGWKDNDDVVLGLKKLCNESNDFKSIVQCVMHHCESSESYSSTACIKNSISGRIGCRLEWDSWSSGDILLCTTVEQLERFEKEYENINRLWQPNIVKKTGCLIPCSYTKYKLATEPMKYEYGSQKLTVAFSSPDVLKRAEQLIYPSLLFLSLEEHLVFFLDFPV
jgi:hypothetical protein